MRNLFKSFLFLALFSMPFSVKAEGIAPAVRGIIEEALSVSAPQPEIKMDDKKPVVAIVIDDVGVDYKHSARAIEKLPAEATLAFLPYGLKIKQQVTKAREFGHEIIVHLPMESVHGADVDEGPNYLSTKQTPAEVRARIVKNLSAFQGFKGVNNHMGSKFTQDEARLEIVMDELKQRGLFFLDSKTTPKSKAEKIAKLYGLDTTGRDVFLDDTETPEAVWASLLQTERIALKTGAAVAIGHPKQVTLNGLEAWIKTLDKKGIKLVPLSRVIELREIKKAKKLTTK